VVIACFIISMFLSFFRRAQVTVDECVDALSQTQWNIHNAIKLVKLSQLIDTGLADKDACKCALMSCQWSVEDAAAYLLNGEQRNTPDDA